MCVLTECQTACKEVWEKHTCIFCITDTGAVNDAFYKFHLKNTPSNEAHFHPIVILCGDNGIILGLAPSDSAGQ